MNHNPGRCSRVCGRALRYDRYIKGLQNQERRITGYAFLLSKGKQKRYVYRVVYHLDHLAVLGKQKRGKAVERRPVVCHNKQRSLYRHPTAGHRQRKPVVLRQVNPQSFSDRRLLFPFFRPFSRTAKAIFASAFCTVPAHEAQVGPLA